MKPSILAIVVLSLTAWGCTPTEEPPPAGQSAAPAEKQASPAKRRWSPFEAAERAYEGAEKSCRGCPNRTACEEALTMSFRMTTAALQGLGGTDADLAEQSAKADILKEQFDGLAMLSNECQPTEEPTGESTEEPTEEPTGESPGESPAS